MANGLEVIQTDINYWLKGKLFLTLYPNTINLDLKQIELTFINQNDLAKLKVQKIRDLKTKLIEIDPTKIHPELNTIEKQFYFSIRKNLEEVANEESLEPFLEAFLAEGGLVELV